MSMGKSLLVKRNERVTAYEPNKEVALRSAKPFRTIVVQFEVLPGKYSVIPLVENITNPSSSRYSLRLYFNCEPDKIKLHSEEPAIRVLEYIPERARSGRNPLFMADEGSHVSLARNAFARKVMTPYTLDGIVNTIANAKKPRSTTSSIEATIAANKKNFETKNVFYEDNAKGVNS